MFIACLKDKGGRSLQCWRLIFSANSRSQGPLFFSFLTTEEERRPGNKVVFDTNFSLSQPSTAVIIKDGSYTFHQENTEHSPEKLRLLCSYKLLRPSSHYVRTPCSPLLLCRPISFKLTEFHDRDDCSAGLSE